MERSIRTPVGTMWVDQAGVLWHRLDEGTVVEVEHAAEVHEAVRKLSNGNPIRAVVDISGVEFADRAARDAFAGPADDSIEVATALIVGSAASRALGTLFLKLSRPSRPVKLFLDENAAVRWVATV